MPDRYGTGKLRRRDAADERQFMIDENYEIYEKQGAPVGALAFHYHNFYELIYVLEGEYSALIEDRTYYVKKGDFLLIDRNVMHKYHYVEKKHDSSKRLVLWITREMLDDLSAGEADLSACFRGQDSCAYHFPIYYEEMLRSFLLKLAMAEIVNMEQPSMRAVLDRGYLTLFFSYLNMLCGRTEYMFAAEESSSHPIVEAVSAYIADHMGETISLEELAEQVHMSKYHFLRRFKELTGLTVHAFVTNKRLIRACSELKEGGRSITEICQDTGFGDYSSFLRNFRKVFGMSPGEYRDYF